MMFPVTGGQPIINDSQESEAPSRTVMINTMLMVLIFLSTFLFSEQDHIGMIYLSRLAGDQLLLDNCSELLLTYESKL